MNDTLGCINNEGQLVFDYYHTDEDTLNNANVYNGQNSTLWVNFRQAFPNKIKETYQYLRSNSVLNYEEIIDQFITNGSDKWSESIYNEDGDFKYVSMLRSDDDATNLPQVRGTGEEHFRYFIENRLNFCDSRWYAGDYPNDYAVVRIYTPVDENNVPLTNLAIPANASITVTPYSHMYAGVRYKANGTLYQERLEANETYTFEAPNEVFNDTETAIYGASQLSSLGDLAPLYLGYIDVGDATKLVELKIGDGTPGYQNSNLYHLAVGTNRLLKKIDIQNCIGFNQALNLSGCPNIEEVYAKGSGITGVDLPASGYLKKLQLPATIANLTLKNQPYVTDFSLEGYTNLKTVQIENCPTINTLDLLDKAINVERVRITNVDWNYSDASVLYELIDRDISGIDENGTNIDTMWIDGKCHIDTLTGNEYAEIKRLYPYLEITYNNLTSQLVFMTDDGETELHRQTIINGANGTDPVESGAIETPTKESTAQYHFTYSGWSLTPGGDAHGSALYKVEIDRYVYVAYYKELRRYDVNFYNDDILLQTKNVYYGTDATYTETTPQKKPSTDYELSSDFEFIGWDPSPTNIQGNTNCYAQYRDKREITDSWEEISRKCLIGQESYYKIGAFKPVTIGATDLPYDFYQSSAVVYNGEIHILGGNGSETSTKHYKWNGSKWLEVSELPYKFYAGNAVVYNDEIHIIGSNNNENGNRFKHCKYDGFSWTEVSTLPRSHFSGTAVVYNNEIHMIGGADSKANKTHYKWNGSEWISVTTLPVTAERNVAVVYNNEILMMIGQNLYKYNGNEWSLCYESIATNFPPKTMVVWNNEVHILSGNHTGSYLKRHWIYNGTECISTNSLPIFFEGESVIHNEELYLLGANDYRRSFYKCNANQEWSAFGDYENINFEIVAHNHDELSKDTWKRVYVGNTSFGGYGVTVSYNGKIHFIAGTTHKTYDGTKIETLPNLPYTAVAGHCKGTVWNNEIHIVGSAGGSNATSSYHYKYDGIEWTSVCEPSYSSYTTGDMVTGYGSTIAVWNDKMYRTVSTGNNKNLYKFDGISWVEVTTLHRGIYQGVLASCKDGLHILVGTDHYKWDGTEYTRVSTLPYDFANGSAIEFLDELHLFGGTKNDKAHYKWDGNDWIRLDDMIDNHAYVGATTALIHNNELYLGGSNPGTSFAFTAKWCIPKWNVLLDHTGTTKDYAFVYNDEIWSVRSGTLNNHGDGSIRNNYYSYSSEILKAYPDYCVLQDEIHMFVGKDSGSAPVHYKYDFTNNDWIIVSSVENVNLSPSYQASCHVYKDKIYYFNCMGKKGYYTFDGTNWSDLYSLPIAAYGGINVVVYNGKLHAFLTDKYNQHYAFDGSNWEFVCETPINMKDIPLVVINNKLYALYYSDGFITYYEFNGSTWVNTGEKITSPYKKMTNSNTIVYQNKIYVVGVNNTDPTHEHYNRLNIARLENPKAGLTFLAKNLLSKPIAFHSEQKQYWSISDLRTFCNGELYDSLPENLKTSISEVTKVSDTGHAGQSLENVNDKVWISSVEELGLESDLIVPGQGTAYTIFTDNNSRIRGNEKLYWTRSANINSSNSQLAIYAASGKLEGISMNNTNGRCLPGFCI